MTLVLLTHFCTEGNNIPQGVAVATAANGLVQAIEVIAEGKPGAGQLGWCAPPSWAGLQ
jgi:hypothetical protein